MIWVAFGAAVSISSAMPDPETIILAAAATAPPVLGQRCLSRSLMATKQPSSEIAALSAPSLQNQAERALGNIPMAASELNSETSDRLAQHGWKVVGGTAERKSAKCELFVSVSNPRKSETLAFTYVTFSIEGSGRVYNYPVLLKHYDYGWRPMVVGEGQAVVW